MTQLVADQATSLLANALRKQLDALPHGHDLALCLNGEWLLGCATKTLERAFTTAHGDDVRVSTDADTDTLLCVVEHWIQSTAQLGEMERDLEGLYDELGASYESLSSIYEIGSDSSLLLHPEEALRRIIDRALAYEADLHAVFWLVDGATIVPAQWRNTATPQARPARLGLIGRALTEQRGIIDNRRANSDDEPELHDAQRVAVTPMMCRDRAVGALVVWHHAEGAFDSRLMGLLTSLASQAAMILEQDRLRKQTVEGERLRREVEISGVIQKTLLLGHAPQHFSGVEFGTVAHASRHIDGDFFGFFEQNAQTIDVLVADVMGKGIPAALVGAGVKSQFLRFAGARPQRHTANASLTPRTIVESVHKEVAAQLIDLGKFVTAVYARIEPSSQRLTIVDCGHTEVLHYRARDHRVVRLRDDRDDQANLPLGFVPGTPYPETEVAIEPGDCLCFYSDGITEATDAQGAMFGVEALAQTLALHRAAAPQEIADAIHVAVTTFATATGVNDDLTCVIAKILPAPRTLEFHAEPGHLQRVRQFADEICRAARASADDTARVLLAVTEAVSNVIRHAYSTDETGIVRIEGEAFADSVRFSIFDHGATFDRDGVDDPAFDGSSDGGFGIFIIEEVMDEVSLGRDANGNNRLDLRMRFKKGNE